MAERNPPWERDELILALDQYFRRRPTAYGKDDPEVLALSKVLNALPIHKDRPDKARFRNANGAYMKLCNFLALDPTYEGKGLERGGKLKQRIWNEFSNIGRNGEPMKVTGRLPFWAVLSLMSVTGLTLILVPSLKRWTWDLGIIKELGIAALVASFLGFTIDRWFKSEIAHDVFVATLGYILPQEFRDEVRRITGYHFICDHHRLIITLEKLNSESVRMTVAVERTMRNITSEQQDFHGIVQVDEWGFAYEKSKIIECEVRREEKIVAAFEPTLAKFDSEHQTLLAETAPVSVGTRQSVTINSKWVEIKRTNDDTDWTFNYPTTGAEIQVFAPDDLNVECWFGTAPEIVEKAKYAAIYTTKQTYFPNQRMRARWWPKSVQS